MGKTLPLYRSCFSKEFRPRNVHELTETAAVAVAERQTAERRALLDVIRARAAAAADGGRRRRRRHGDVSVAGATQPALGDELVGVGEHGVVAGRHVVVQHEQRLRAYNRSTHRQLPAIDAGLLDVE